MSKQVLILGASSAIARATASVFASKGHPLYLAGRDLEDLSRLASDLKIRHGITVQFGFFDAEDYGSHDKFLRDVVQQMGGLEGVIVALGYLGDQRVAVSDFKEGELIIKRNFTGVCSILSHCANYLESRKKGFIIGISSVAGDRGRQSNYFYGAAKGGLSLYLQGLRNRLFPAGVRVITIKPGFVDTAMTFVMPGLFLVVSPQYAGERIARSLRRPEDIVYVPWFWRYIMWIIRMIPEPVFKRLKL